MARLDETDGKPLVLTVEPVNRSASTEYVAVKLPLLRGGNASARGGSRQFNHDIRHTLAIRNLRASKEYVTRNHADGASMGVQVAAQGGIRKGEVVHRPERVRVLETEHSPPHIERFAVERFGFLVAAPVVAYHEDSEVRPIIGPLRKPAKALAYLRRHGVSKTWRYARERLTNPYHERRLGIRTIGKLAPEELGFTDPFAFEYYPADYPTIYKCLRRLKIRPGLDGFLDFGCGMGRVVVVAGTYRFRSVIGVELSPLLAEMARANLVRARPKLRCGDARIVTADARTFVIPAEIHHVFLYCPFDVPILRSVFSNIFDSLRQSPRPLTVTFKNPTYFEPLMTEFPWLVKRTEFRACDARHKVMILDARL